MFAHSCWKAETAPPGRKLVIPRGMVIQQLSQWFKSIVNGVPDKLAKDESVISLVPGGEIRVFLLLL